MAALETASSKDQLKVGMTNNKIASNFLHSMLEGYQPHFYSHKTSGFAAHIRNFAFFKCFGKQHN